MTENKYCSDCGSVLTPGANACECGFKVPGKKKGPAHNAQDGRCRWTNGNQRCPATGTMSTNTNGGGPYYCRWHFRPMSAADGNRVMDELVSNGVPETGRWMEEVMRRQMEDNHTSLDELIADMRPAAKVNPQQAGEDALNAYRRRRDELEGLGMSKQMAHEKAIKALGIKQAA